MRPSFLVALLCLVLAAPMEGRQARQTRPRPLLHAVLDGEITELALRAERCRPVVVDRARLTTGEPLTVELFDGEALVARHRATTPTRRGGFVWSGDLENTIDGDVTLAVHGEAVFGSIRLGERLLRLSPAGADASATHWLTLEDETRFAGCATPAATRPTVFEPGAGAVERSSAAPTIDVLVVYSTEAKNVVGSTAAMESLIALAIIETNDAYAACGVTQRLRLVHTEEMLGYTEPSSFSAILSHLTAPADGRLDEAHELRNTHGADAVVMICKNGQYCGIAHLMTNVGPGFQSQAFSVVNHGCATGYYSFGHELGHNFGSHHDPANAGGAAYPYSYGYRTPNSQFRTIMAYSPGTRVKRFSSPSATWMGNVMGTASQDNARSQNNTAPTVAAWRAAVPQPSILTSTPMVAGQSATLTVTEATPMSTILLGFSLTGGGPTPSPYGNALLSPPIRLFATLYTGEGVSASTTTSVPPGASGLTAWFQALDLGSGLLGNGLQVAVQ